MTSQFWVQWWHFWRQWVTVVFYGVFFTSLWSDHHISSLYLVWEMTSQFWVQWWRFWRQWVSIHHYGQIIILHHCIWYERWRPYFGRSGDAFGGNGFLLFFMVFLYIGMVRSSYIIIVSGMGDDVPILGALVTLFGAMGNCCFRWCSYTIVWSDHHISSLSLVWEMTCQF